MQHVVVTGAAGFIGGALARDALGRGARVTVIGHGLDMAADWDAGGAVRRIAGTVGADTLDRLPAPPDVVFHCAGGANVQASIAAPEADHARTVGSTAALAGWLAANAPAARVVYPSSGAVYGAAAGRPEGRSGACVPLSPYGLHKAAAEGILTATAATTGLRIAIVRLFSVYGPGLRKQLLWDACRKMQAGDAAFFGTGVERRDFVEIADAVRLMWLAADAAAAPPLVIDGGSGIGVSVQEVLHLLAAAFEPRPAVRFLGAARAGDPTDMIAQAAGAAALGWSPQVPLAEGLARYAKWFRSEQL
ncbi:MAG: NAD-dependent epimerase/dehydratase family protein [Gemmobacter sp.]